MPDTPDALARYRPRLMGYLLHLVGAPEEAEDLFQEVSLAVLENPAMLERAGDLFAYLRGVARHLAAGRHRTRVRTTEALRRWTEWAWEADTPDEVTEQERLRQLGALRRCREALPEKTGALIEMRYDSGWGLEMIAERTGTAAGAVKAALYRARRALADCIRRTLAAEGSW